MTKTITFAGDYWGKQLWCSDCGEQGHKVAGTRMVYEAHPATKEDPAEPAEYERVTWGKARTPDPAERFVRMNDEILPVPTEFYICDGCNAPISPGDRCMAWSVWGDPMPEPPAWEQEYIETLKNGAKLSN